MVALKKYARIEALGLWRADADSQRRDVVVVLGDATLTIKATNDQALGHWSIAAIERANPGKTPARYHPDGDPSEELELPASEAEMIEAIETLRSAVDRARPRPGRVRWFGFGLSAALVAYAAIFWAPTALLEHTLGVVPKVGRDGIGQALFSHIQRVTGPACGTSTNTSSLARLGARLDAPRLAIMRGGLDTAHHLPGGRILLARQVVEDFEAPDVVAGFILTEIVAARQSDPLRDLLVFAGTVPTFRLLTTGKLDPATLDRYAEHLLTAPRDLPEETAVIDAFRTAEVRSTPYAFARDVTGEETITLIEGDPLRDRTAAPILSDSDWLRLQAICDS